MDKFLIPDDRWKHQIGSRAEYERWRERELRREEAAERRSPERTRELYEEDCDED